MKDLILAIPMMPEMATPKIPMDFLWDLIVLFGVISAVFALLIFVFRHRISTRAGDKERRRKELAPMISQYLFYPQESGPEGEEASFRGMLQFRYHLDADLDRQVLAEILLELVQDVSGESRRRLLDLYQNLGLQEGAYQKLRSRRWEKVSLGIRELSEMQVQHAYYIIRRFVHHRNSILRKQAQFAIISLTDEGIGYFMDTTQHGISEWQQMEIMEILRRKQGFNPPEFAYWLTSENEDVVLFALRLIRYYGQRDAAGKVLRKLEHISREIRIAAMECLRDFEYMPAKEPLQLAYKEADVDSRILILDTLHNIGDQNDIQWLQAEASRDPSFLVRGKAKAVLASLQGKGSPVHETQANIPPKAEEVGAKYESDQEQGMNYDLTEDQHSLSWDVTSILKPDFGTLDSSESGSLAHAKPEWVLAVAQYFPEELWNDELQSVFDECTLETLLETFSEGYGKEDPEEEPPAFIPHVTDQNPDKRNVNPNEPTPDWLLRIEVQAEVIFSDHGYDRMLREILLKDLEETGKVLNTEFVPWVTPSESELEEGAEDPNQAIPEEPVNVSPDFGVMADAISHKPDTATADSSEADTRSKTYEAEGEVSYFSIFQEFFRSYDTESKLILMDEIPEIGGAKELHFLSTLLNDPDQRIRKKARKTHDILASRINSEETEAHTDGGGTLWTPRTEKASKESAVGSYGDKDQSGPEDTECFELNFTPEFEFSASGESRESGSVLPKVQDDYLKFLQELNKSQSNDYE